MNHMKRMLAMLLALVMIVGVLPLSVFADEYDTATGNFEGAATSILLDAAIFCSDVHGSTSDLKSVLGGVAKSGVNYSSIGFVGDTCLTVANTTSIVQSALSDTNISVMFSYASSHDTESGADISTNWNYSGEVKGVSSYYLVYTIREDDVKTYSSAKTAAAAFTTWYSGLTDAQKTLPIFVMSHRPLHARRGGNQGGEVWTQAFNAAGATSDIVVFWAHNHTGENSTDTGYYYVAKGGTLNVATSSGSSSSLQNGTESGTDYEIAFTYMNAGYINANNQNPARLGVATTVQITASSLIFQDYNSSGEYSGTYAHNVTIDREFAPATPKTLAVTGKTDYTVGDDIDPPSNVEITYLDGTTGTITSGYALTKVTDANGNEVTLTDNKFAAAGTYYLVYTCTLGSYQAQAKLKVTVEETKKTVSYILAEGTTAYTVGDKLTFDVTVVYTDGTMIKVTQDDCELTMTCSAHAACADVATAMQTVACELGDHHQVKVTYGGKKDYYEFTVGAAESLTGEAEGVVVSVSSGVVASVSTAVSTNANVDAAMTAEGVENYVAYDISPEFALKAGNYATVSLPVPEGVDNPVVYYVSDDGTIVTNMNAKIVDGKAVFTTDHFSTYVVGRSTDVTVPEGENATGSGSTTTTEEKEVYVLVSSISGAGDYLIVNTNSATTSANLLTASSNGVTNTSGVTITTGTDANGNTVTYIEDPAAAAIWTAAVSGSGYTLRNTSSTNRYLRYSNNNFTTSSNSSTTWYSGTNTVYKTDSTRYIRYNNGWTTSSNSQTVYIYQKQTVNFATTTTVDGTYSIAGNPAEITKVVTEGAKLELGSILTFKPTSGAATTTENPTGVTYTVVEGGDPNGVISGINGNTVTFSGNYGKALVKVSYTVSENNVATNYIVVTATAPTYTLDITDDGAVVTGTTIAKKGVTNTTTLQLGTKIQFVDEDGAEIVELPEGATIEWHIPAEYHSIATVDHETGLISFKGVDGAFYVTATLTVNGKDYTVGVNISASTSSYSTPTDGPADFPEYPNEGAIRFDKTATAVGNFSQTGIAQIELSMTGVPYTTGSEMDVVIMLDQSTSMGDDRIAATVAATKAFIQSIVINEDGTYNGNRIYVGYFNGSKTYDISDSDNIGGDLASIDNKTELDALFASIDDDFDGSPSTSGTEYGVALEKCYNRLNTAKTDGTGNDRQQFCVFMSDGVPTTYQYSATGMHGTSGNTQDGYSDMKGMFTGTNYDTRSSSYVYEYYSTQMKANGVTVYTVGLGLNAKNNAWSNASATQCLNAASLLLNDIAGPAYETELGTGSDLNKKDSYFFSVEDEDSASQMTNVFKAIAQKILQAATDVTVEDKITDEYTMIFDIPTGDKTITGVTNDFYIEFGKYALDEDHERTTFTSVTKLYLQKTNGVLSAKDATAPVFEQKTIGDKGTLYYWSTNASDGDTGISVTVSGTTYYFVSYGMEQNEDGTAPDGWYNMTSGAYANGTVDATNMSQNLVIATPYFVYNAATRMLYWTVDKLDTTEYVLRYFLYLDDSATEVGTGKEVDPGSYPTNDHAYLTYTNFKGHDCRQEFVKPQLTWNGAQVSYVFYLVNAQGQPINKSGQVVDFANAVFVTDVFTEDTVWNKDGDTSTGTGQLSANWLAHELLPDEYEIYDEKARYVLNVYENADGTTIKNQFTISGGTAAEISASLNERLKLTTTTASISTTKVYNTKAGQKISAYGTYTSADSSMKDFDFANTTVAFAVVWQPRLVEDTVVVDFGLDVIINVVQNDILQNKVTGIGVGKEAYGNIAMNTGVSTDSKLGNAALTIDGNTISIESETSIRFHQGDMVFTEPVVFYYETPVEFWEGSDKKEGFMYSSVTVIPATTIYYEDEYVTLKTYTSTGNTDENGKTIYNVADGWDINSVDATATQAQDRPGVSQISKDIDADNNYGFDAAYSSMSQFSMGSAAMTKVNAGKYATATFTFWGTGFDIIGLTSNTTGVLAISIKDANDTNVGKGRVVDTYYGYKHENGKWVITDSNDPNALYQVPVMKAIGLDYGKYTVTITATYVAALDHTAAEGYDLYLDAVRIYDPTGVVSGDTTNDKDGVVSDAYVKDGEGWPSYAELRNLVIDATGVTVDKDGKVTIPNDAVLSGLVFIDGINGTNSVENYMSYGPNNELYLAKGQSIAFALNKEGQDFAKTGFAVDKVQLAFKSVGGTGHIVIKDTDGKVYYDMDVATATDMYYDISELDGKDVIIQSTGSAIISLTNIKVTYKVVQTNSENGEPPVSIMSLARAAKTEEEETYLISVNAEMIERVLNMLNGKVEVEPERPFEPAPGKPSKPGSGNKPVAPKPSQPIKPSVPAKPIKPVRPVVPTMPVNPSLPGIPGRPAPVVAIHIY